MDNASYAQGVADERERAARIAIGPGDLGDEEAYYGKVIAEAIRNTGHASDMRRGMPTLAAHPSESAATPAQAEPVAPSFDADAVRKSFEESFLTYFGRGPEGAQFDQPGEFWLEHTDTGRYESARVDDAWTGWLAAARRYAHIETLWRVAKLGHEQAFAECQRLASAPQEPVAPSQEPSGYAYEYPGPYGGIAFTHGEERNGSKPIRAIPYWFATPPKGATQDAGEPAPVDRHLDASDRFKVERGPYWWTVRIGDGQQTAGKFHTEKSAQELAFQLLRAFRDGAFAATQEPQSAATQDSPQEALNARSPLELDAARYRWLAGNMSTSTPKGEDTALRPIDDEDQQFLHYNPNTADLVEFVQAYARTAILEDRKRHRQDAARWRALEGAIEETAMFPETVDVSFKLPKSMCELDWDIPPRLGEIADAIASAPTTNGGKT